jgi:hypothetical protein
LRNELNVALRYVLDDGLCLRIAVHGAKNASNSRAPAG